MNYLLLILQVALLSLLDASEQPQFKGGARALNAFLTHNMIYPEYSKQNCISGTIQVRFQIQPDGKLFNVQVEKGLGIDLDDEAIRIVKLTKGKWMLPRDYDSRVSLILPIQFNLDEPNCRQVDRDDITAAIAAYKARESLVNAVTNYYINRYAGKANPADEPAIISLKQQLGFNEKFAERMARQANRKLKQGDKQGACEDWLFVHNIGSPKADQMLSRHCK